MYQVVLYGSNIMGQIFVHIRDISNVRTLVGQIFAHTRDISDVSGRIARYIFLMYRIVMHGDNVMWQFFAHTRDISNASCCNRDDNIMQQIFAHHWYFEYTRLYCMEIIPGTNLCALVIFRMYRVVLHGSNTMGQIFAHTRDIYNLPGRITWW